MISGETSRFVGEILIVCKVMLGWQTSVNLPEDWRSRAGRKSREFASDAQLAAGTLKVRHSESIAATAANRSVGIVKRDSAKNLDSFFVSFNVALGFLPIVKSWAGCDLPCPLRKVRTLIAPMSQLTKVVPSF